MKVKSHDMRDLHQLNLNPPDNGGANTTGAQRFCSRRLMSLELDRFSLINRTVFIRFFKAAPQFAPYRTPSPAIADMFTVQTEFWGEMGLFKEWGFNDGFFFFHQVINGEIGFGPVNASFQFSVRCYAHAVPPARGAVEAVEI